MKSINDQITDWNKLRKLCAEIKSMDGEPKKELIREFHKGIKNYYQTYCCKFDYQNKPK